MRCEDVRRHHVVGPHGIDPVAEAHLQACADCFAWLEERDLLAQAVRAARPPDVAPSVQLAPRVLDAWRTGRAAHPVGIPDLWGLIAAAVLAAVAAASLVAVYAVAGDQVGRLIGILAGALGPLVDSVGGVVSFAFGQLGDHPASLMALAALAGVAAWGWARIDLGLASNDRRATR